MADGAKGQFGKHEMKLLDIRNQFFRAYGNAIHEAKTNADSRAARSDDAVLRAAWSEMFGTNYGGAIRKLDGLSAFMRSKSSVAQMKKAANDAANEYRQNKLAVLSQYDRFSRPGAKDKMAVEDRFYFGKDRFASTAEWTVDIERNALEWLYILNMAAAGNNSQTTREKIKQTANALLEAISRQNSSMSIKAIETAKALKRSAEI